jgi:hypothetical protein
VASYRSQSNDQHLKESLQGMPRVPNSPAPVLCLFVPLLFLISCSSKAYAQAMASSEKTLHSSFGGQHGITSPGSLP